MPKNTVTTLVVGLLCASSLLSRAEEKPLALKPAETIIVNHTPTGRGSSAAAGLLQNWLRKAAKSETGFDLVKPEAAAANPAKARIVLEDPAVELPKDFSDDGFVVKRVGNTIQIKGLAGDATLFGAVEFLRQLGINFYLPGDLFTTLPKSPELEVGALKIESTPFVQSAFFSGIPAPEQSVWARLNGVNRRKGGTHQHNSFAIFPPEKFAERYPELYPIIDGKRHIPVNAKDQSWQPNFIEPVAVDAALESILEYFQTNPGFRYVAVSIQDGSGFDQGPKTTAVVERYKKSGVDHPIDRATSEIYWDFVTKLAGKLKEKAPGKQLVALAYGGTRFPPKYTLPENVVVFTNFHIAEYGYYEKEKGEGVIHEMGPDAWLKIVKHYGNHDWYQGSGYVMPRSYSGSWSKYLRQIAASVPDAYMHVETYPNWGFDGQKLYVLSRLIWNPSLDPVAVTRQFSDDLFGAGGPAMADYFAIQEKLWTQLNVTEGPERKLAAWTRAFVTTPASRQLIKEARQTLDEAASKVSTPEEKARLELFSDCFRVSELFFNLAASDSVDQAELEKNIAFIEGVLKNHGLMAAMHPRTVIPGFKELASFVRRASAPAYRPKTIAARESVLPTGDPIWSSLPAEKFTMPTGEEDAQLTTLKVADDGANIYVLVNSPFARERELVLDEGSTWRADNIEFKFDTDGNWGALEGQFWVKPTGRLVDWIDREDKKDSLITSEVKKTDEDYLVSVRIPYAYLKQVPGKPSQVGMQVFRNEFKLIPGMNQTDYVSIWAGKLDLKKD